MGKEWSSEKMKVLLPEEGVAMWQGKAAEHLLPLSSKLRLCGHLLNPHLWLEALSTAPETQCWPCLHQ